MKYTKTLLMAAVLMAAAGTLQADTSVRLHGGLVIEGSDYQIYLGAPVHRYSHYADPYRYKHRSYKRYHRPHKRYYRHHGYHPGLKWGHYKHKHYKHKHYKRDHYRWHPSDTHPAYTHKRKEHRGNGISRIRDSRHYDKHYYRDRNRHYRY